jgi:hypothetical protein
MVDRSNSHSTRAVSIPNRFVTLEVVHLRLNHHGNKRLETVRGHAGRLQDVKVEEVFAIAVGEGTMMANVYDEPPEVVEIREKEGEETRSADALKDP